VASQTQKIGTEATRQSVDDSRTALNRCRGSITLARRHHSLNILATSADFFKRFQSPAAIGASEAGEAPCDDPRSPRVTTFYSPVSLQSALMKSGLDHAKEQAKVWSTSLALRGLPKSVQPEDPSRNTKRRSGAADRTSFEKSIGSISR